MKEHKILRNVTFLKFWSVSHDAYRGKLDLKVWITASHYSRYKKGKLASPEKEGTSVLTQIMNLTQVVNIHHLG